MIIKNDDYIQQPILIKSVFMKSHPPRSKKTIAYKNDVCTILQTPFWILCFAVHCPTEVRRVDEKQAMNRCVAYSLRGLTCADSLVMRIHSLRVVTLFASNQKLLGCSSRASVPPGLSVLFGSKYALSALNNLSCSLPIEPSRYGAKSLPMP